MAVAVEIRDRHVDRSHEYRDAPAGTERSITVSTTRHGARPVRDYDVQSTIAVQVRDRDTGARSRIVDARSERAPAGSESHRGGTRDRDHIGAPVAVQIAQGDGARTIRHVV